MDPCSSHTCHFTDYINHKGDIVRNCYYCLEHNYLHVCGDERLPHPAKYVGPDKTCLISGRSLHHVGCHQKKKKSAKCLDEEPVDDAAPDDAMYIFHVHEFSGLSIKLNPFSAKWSGGGMGAVLSGAGDVPTSPTAACSSSFLDAENLNKERLYVAKMNAKVEEMFTPQLYARAVTSLIENHDRNIIFFIKVADGWVRRLSSIVQRCYAYIISHMDLHVNNSGNASTSTSLLPTHSTVDNFESKLRHFIDISARMIVDRMARHCNVGSAEKLLDERAPSSVSDAHGDLSLLILEDLTCAEKDCMPYLVAFDGTTDPGRSRNTVKARLFKNYFVPPPSTECTIKTESVEEEEEDGEGRLAVERHKKNTTGRKRKMKSSSCPYATAKKRGDASH